jgi:hypothetical protein
MSASPALVHCDPFKQPNQILPIKPNQMTIIYNSLSARLRFLSSVCGLKHLSGAKAAGAFVLPLVLGIFLVLSGSKAFAQVNTYTFGQTTGTYTAITGGSVLYSGGFDDGTTSQTLPFTFAYNGVNYTQVWVATNGHLVFGAADPTAGGYLSASVISQTVVTTGAVAAWGQERWVVRHPKFVQRYLVLLPTEPLWLNGDVVPPTQLVMQP